MHLIWNELLPLARTATVVLRVVQIRIKTRSSLITLIVTIIATAIITTTIAIAVAIAIALAIAVAAAVAIALAMAAREAKGGWVGYPPTQATGGGRCGAKTNNKPQKYLPQRGHW